jgi:hypothetical protein
MVVDREKEIKKKMEEKEEIKIEKQIVDTNKLALKAIQKEINLEQMIKQEEEEKETREEQEILFQIQEEKKKSDCLNKAIKEKTLETQYNLKAKEAESEVEKIKEETAQQISTRRAQLNEVLRKYRQSASRKKMKLKQKLQNVRYEMAQQMGKAYKKGDSSKCSNALKSDTERKTYCTVAFSDDYNNYQTCLDGGSDFCVLCCEAEFGDFYANDRQECKKKVCEAVSITKLPDPDKPKNSNNGRWIWQDAMQPPK